MCTCVHVELTANQLVLKLLGKIFYLHFSSHHKYCGGIPNKHLMLELRTSGLLVENFYLLSNLPGSVTIPLYMFWKTTMLLLRKNVLFWIYSLKINFLNYVHGYVCINAGACRGQKHQILLKLLSVLCHTMPWTLNSGLLQESYVLLPKLPRYVLFLIVKKNILKYF